MSLRDEINDLMGEHLRRDPFVLDLQFLEEEEAAKAFLSDPKAVVRSLDILAKANRGKTAAIQRLADEVDALRASL